MVRTESKPDPQKQLMIKVKACQRYDELFVVYIHIFIISISISIVFLTFCGLFFLTFSSTCKYHICNIDLSRKLPIMKRN